MVNKEPQSSELPIFLGCDQPETCRKCGARTDFIELTNDLQLHRCLACQNGYLVEFEAHDVTLE